MSARHHAEWLSLVPVSGPFLSLPVLLEAFPQGLDAHDPEHSRLLRLAYEEWEDSFERRHPDPAVHAAWVRFVLTKTLEFDESLLAEGQAISQTLQAEMAEHGELLRPDIVLNDAATKKARLLVQTYPRSQELSSYVAGSRWKASPDTRMTELLHATGVRLGLVTNGEHWMLVDAPKGETTGYASWYASLWLEEKVTLRAFRSLLSLTRFFGVADDQTIESLLAKSASNQQEVTDQLGYQVRRAVEVLIQSLDRADQDHGRELLAGVSEAVLYESALTVMMRLVFLFCAEERELIPTKPFPVYEQNYSVSTISRQLREIADQQGEELLERRYDAWPRLLTAFRTVYGGVRHDDIHVPAYGGRLFDPDRFPFLEGRKQGTTWRVESGGWGDAVSPHSTPHTPLPTFQEASPLPVNNRTVLHLLEALQLLQVKVPGGGPAEARRLSFRALDIEQIGHVYEGLLDHTAKRATEPFLGLAGGKNKEPEVPLAELERLRGKGEDDLLKYLKDETGRSVKALEKALKAEFEGQDIARFRTACQREALWQRVEPFAGLVRLDSFGYPVVIPQGSVFVTEGTDRRSSGTHYTPRSLTEPIVRYTLEPLVYVGPAEGQPKSDWRLKSAAELLDLKICDMACGSGAFLVQAARYMAERLMEAWDAAEWGVGSGEWGEQSEVRRGECDGTTELSGPGGLAEGDDAGRGVLQGDDDVSEGRTLRDDEPDSPGRSLHPGEHRRGAGAAAHKGVPQLSQRGEGITQGSGNTPDVEPAGRPDHSRASGAATEVDRRDQPHDVGTSKDPRKTTLTSPRTPLPAPHIPRITPEGSPATGALHEQLVPDEPAERETFAMRLVAQRCLYGVDVNPLAVEMAKLSLWLLTLAKDRPFEFLDHAIRCGDSLVGLHDLEQLRHYSLEPVADDAVLFKGPLDEAVDEAIALRLRLGDMPANTVEDIEAQEALLREAEDRIARLRCAADLLVAAEFWGENARDKQERVRHAAVASGHYVEHGPTGEFEEQAAKERRGQKMFHWPLEFPEVIVKRGGFDAFVGNPPFMGGQRITGLFSVYYRNLLVTHLAFGKRGSADLCAFFFLRAASLLSIDTGHLGFLSTNTIAQGDTRQVCLDQLIDNGYSITRALPTTQWPGIASIEIAELWLYRGKWIAPALLDGTPVESITPYLTAQEVVCGSPFRLVRNANTAFIGSQVQGAGFVLNPEKAQLLIRSSNNNRRVLFPYLRGQDFNTEPDLSPQSWVINFFDWPLDESGGRPCASDFPECLEIVERLVKPQRESMKGRNAIADKRAKYWWHYGSPAPTLYRRIEELELSRVLFHSFTSKYVAFGFAPVGIVYAAPHVVFTRSDDHDFAILQSSLHESWVIQYCSTMRTDIRYAPSDVFETFPFPSDSNESYAEVKSMGCEYYAVRQAIMCNTGLGLTKTYNRFHAPDETAADIQKLRELHVEMDQAVAAAYGWGDLDLGHGFHETKQGLRYTISEAARREVLQRLLRLNHERYAEEVRQGLHDKKKGQGKRAGAAKKRKIPSSAAPKLFGDADETR